MGKEEVAQIQSCGIYNKIPWVVNTILSHEYTGPDTLKPVENDDEDMWAEASIRLGDIYVCRTREG